MLLEKFEYKLDFALIVYFNLWHKPTYLYNPNIVKYLNKSSELQKVYELHDFSRLSHFKNFMRQFSMKAHKAQDKKFNNFIYKGEITIKILVS